MNAEYHPEALLILPLLGISLGECSDPECDADHWRISVGWFVWTVHFVI